MTANIIIIRPLNLLIILVTMYIFKLGLINLFIQNPALNNFTFSRPFIFLKALSCMSSGNEVENPFRYISIVSLPSGSINN